MKKFSVLVRCATVFALFLCLGAAVQAEGYDDLFGNDGASSSPPASSGGSNFSESDIDDLFGKKEESAAKAAPEVVKRQLPPFEGTYKVLISRPIYAVYETETRTKWISAAGEIFTHYKIASFPRTHAFTMEQISGVLPNFRDYSRRLNRAGYIDAAQKLGATHLVYQEYQPQKDGRTTRYTM